MDTKYKTYIGYGLALVLIILGLNGLFGGDQITVSGYDLLPLLAIVTPVYFLAVMRKKK